MQTHIFTVCIDLSGEGDEDAEDSEKEDIGMDYLFKADTTKDDTGPMVRVFVNISRVPVGLNDDITAFGMIFMIITTN